MQQARDQQHVRGEQARDDRGARELATEQEERHVGADHGHRLHEPVGGSDAGAGEQVVGERVAGEALEGAEQQQQAADHPVELTGLAEGAGEVDPEQVDHHRGDEDHGCPVVDLAHQQAGAYVEGDVQGGCVGLGHVDAAELVVGPVVDDLDHARAEPQGQEHPGEEQDDEAPQRDLAQHERPVVGEDLADVLLRDRGEAEAVVGPGGCGADLGGLLGLGGLLAVGLGNDGHRQITHVPRSSGRLAR